MPALTKDALLDATLPHVVFDGWSQASLDAALGDLGASAQEARLIAPRGAIDLAVHYHHRGDALMVAALAEADLGALRYRDRVALALRLRLEAITDPEAVRRASALFALPHHAPEGAGLIWATADAIWRALGDTSEDVNWYSKRATLSAVWSSTLLYWLGDTSEGRADTAAFIDRRIDNVMQIETAKANVRKSPVLRTLFAPLSAVMAGVRAPMAARRDLPGSLAEAHDARD